MNYKRIVNKLTISVFLCIYKDYNLQFLSQYFQINPAY